MRSQCYRDASSTQALTLTRRSLLASIVGGALTAASGARGQTSLDAVDAIINQFEASPELAAPNYSMREFAENFPRLKLERHPSRVSPSELLISDTAKKLIIACEVSSDVVYVERYQHPVWPGGQSGVTIGVGYDIGYVNSEDLSNDWAGILDAATLDKLSVACGVTNVVARDLAQGLADVTVSWAQASKQFGQELKKYVALTQKGLPNFALLTEDRRGALVSLVIIEAQHSMRLALATRKCGTFGNT